MFADKDYRHFMDMKWGIDLLGQQATQKNADCGLDNYYFWQYEDGYTDDVYLKIVK